MNDFKTTDDIIICEMPKGTHVVAQYMKATDTLSVSPSDFAMKHREFTKEILADNTIFGTWDEETDKWYVHDIANIDKKTYFTQKELYDFCIAHNFLCVDVKYRGKFHSVEHCLSFLRHADKNKVQGIWIKQDVADAEKRRTCFYTLSDKVINMDEIKRT